MSTKIKSALRLSSLTPESKVTKAQSVIDAMQGSGNFPAGQMPITYASLQQLVDDLHNAIVAANNGTAAHTSDMHEKERMLVTAFNLIKAHVDYAANLTTDPGTIITSAGLQVASSGGSSGVSELTLDALGGGEVQVRVPRNTDEKAFVYEMSTDGNTFAKVSSSSLAKISITGQTPGATIHVRYYAISKLGEGSVSSPKSIMVV